jgi:hypothetical protein
VISVSVVGVVDGSEPLPSPGGFTQRQGVSLPKLYFGVRPVVHGTFGYTRQASFSCA